MSNTIVVVSDNGQLVNVSGVNCENDPRYLKLAARLLGDNGSKAVLNYGWNGRASLTITGANGTGEQITLDAAEVVVPGTLKINGKTLQQVVDASMDIAMSGVVGTAGEIDVTVSPNPSAGTPGQPAKLYAIGLDGEILDRVESLESIVAGVIRFDDVYRIGDGLAADEDYLGKILSVRLGYGLKFVTIDDSGDSGSSSPSEPDEGADSTPTPRPRKIKAISLDPDIITPRYAIEQNNLGNIVLYDTDAT